MPHRKGVVLHTLLPLVGAMMTVFSAILVRMMLFSLLPLVGAMMTLMTEGPASGPPGLLPLVGAMMTWLCPPGVTQVYALLPLVGAMMTLQPEHRQRRRPVPLLPLVGAMMTPTSTSVPPCTACCCPS